MRYHYEKPQIYTSIYGEIYTCDHPVYNRGTLFRIGDKGFVVIQQRYDETTKKTWWGEIDLWLVDEIYLHPRFKEFFDDRASECADCIYPTVTIRQVMWALKMKPLPRERWETVFDRKKI